MSENNTPYSSDQPSNDPGQPNETPAYDAGANQTPPSDAGQYGSQTPSYDQGQYGAQQPTYDQGQYAAQQPTYDQGQYAAQTPAYGQGQYSQPGTYGQPAYGAPAEHPQSQLVFILGIVGIFVPIVAWIDWYLGGKAKKEIEAGAPFPWSGNIKTGYTLAKVFSIIHIVWIALYIIGAILFAVLAASSGY